MLDWKDREQVEGTDSGESFENGDHIVPQAVETEEISFSLGDDRKKQMKEKITSGRRSTDQTCETEDNFRSYHLENSSCCNANEEFTASEITFDAFSALPTVSSSCSMGYGGGQEHDPRATVVIEDLIDNSELNSLSECMTECQRSGFMLQDKDSLSVDQPFSNSRTMQLGSEPELFGRVYEDKEIDGLPDFDGATFEDMDFDTIFRDEKVGISDGFLSPSTDVTSSTTEFNPNADISFCKDEAPDKGCSSIWLDEHPERKRNALPKEKVDEQENSLISGELAETKSKNKQPCNLNGSWSHKTCENQQNPKQKMSNLVKTHLQAQQKKVRDSEHGVFTGSANMYPSTVLPPHDAKKSRKGPACYEHQPDPLKHSVSSDKVPDAVFIPCNGTHQEKIEKQKQQQQTQTMIAIEKKQQTHVLQITGAGNSVSQSSSQKSLSQDAATSSFGMEEISLPSLEQNIESQRTSMLSDEHSLEEMAYYRLQDALGKLTIGLRLCIRDSLFRLARSATERQSISDSSSTNKNNKDEEEVAANGQMNSHGRDASSPASETDTNCIDRIVAQLLFQRSSSNAHDP